MDCISIVKGKVENDIIPFKAENPESDKSAEDVAQFVPSYEGHQAAIYKALGHRLHWLGCIKWNLSFES